MLITFTYPIADLRRFSNTNGGLLKTPAWPSPIPDKDFVRSMGVIQRRVKGGLDGWLLESLVCNARRITFPTTQKFIITGNYLPVKVCWKLAFRRFFFDGRAVGKFDFGFSCKRDKSMSRLSTDLDWIFSIIDRLASVSIGGLNKNFLNTTFRLLTFPSYLEKLYVRASTQLGAQTNLASSVSSPVIVGDPLIFIELDNWNKWIRFHPKFKNFKSKPIHRNDFSLVFLKHLVKGKRIDLCLVVKNPTIQKDACRHLRLYITRLYVEHFVLMNTISKVSNSRINPEANSLEAEALDSYLKVTTRRIGRYADQFDSYLKEMSTTPEESLSKELFSLFRPGEVSSLLESINQLKIRNRSKWALEGYAKKYTSETSGGVFFSHNTFHIEGGGRMEITNVNQTGDGNIANINSQNILNRVNVIKDSIVNSSLNEDIKNLLNKLSEHVEPLAGKLSQQDSDTLVKDYEDLTKEATSQNPSQRRIKSFGEGIIEAAKKVAEFGAPAIELVNTILKLMGVTS